MVTVFPWARLLVAVAIFSTALLVDPRVAWVLVVAALVLAAHAVWRIVEEHRDRFVITNMRVFRVHGTFNTQRASVPLGRILDITVQKPFVGRLLNYGHFVFESAAQVQGISEIRFVADIDGRDAVLQETMQRAGLRATAPAQDDGT
jgi:membrane protein YdbS with pleckstrin-like domain